MNDEADPDDHPNAEDDHATTPYNTPVTVPVLPNDSDPNNDALTVTQVTHGAHGNCTIEGNNEIRYQPNLDYFGFDVCPYVVCNSDGKCDTADVFVEVGLPPEPVSTYQCLLTRASCQGH